jgi:hypothetical protein
MVETVEAVETVEVAEVVEAVEAVIEEVLAEPETENVNGTVQNEKPSLVAPSQVTAGKTVEVARERQVCAQWGMQL